MRSSPLNPDDERVLPSGQEAEEREAIRELERLEVADGPLNANDQKHLENLLILRAYVCGWTGDPLEQPATAVLAAYRQMRAE